MQYLAPWEWDQDARMASALPLSKRLEIPFKQLPNDTCSRFPVSTHAYAYILHQLSGVWTRSCSIKQAEAIVKTDSWWLSFQLTYNHFVNILPKLAIICQWRKLLCFLPCRSTLFILLADNRIVAAAGCFPGPSPVLSSAAQWNGGGLLLMHLPHVFVHLELDRGRLGEC